MFSRLNFPEYTFQIQETDRKKVIFDVVRKKYVSLTPEEWVRQHVIHHLIHDKHFPVSLIAVESSIKFQGMNRRCDLIAYKNNQPWLLIECKAPQVQLNKEVIAQIARYQSVLKVPLLFITNGMQHILLRRTDLGKMEVASSLPPYQD
ncbi:MAG: restriction endonuclease subunit R [Bacteroidetes bacterium]|nr:restriction endonuclease subunit R [Bacteroidota bacterium]